MSLIHLREWKSRKAVGRDDRLDRIVRSIESINRVFNSELGKRLYDPDYCPDKDVEHLMGAAYFLGNEDWSK